MHAILAAAHPDAGLLSLPWFLDSEGQVELSWVKTHQVDAKSYLEHPTWDFVGVGVL